MSSAGGSGFWGRRGTSGPSYGFFSRVAGVGIVGRVLLALPRTVQWVVAAADLDLPYRDEAKVTRFVNRHRFLGRLLTFGRNHPIITSPFWLIGVRPLNRLINRGQFIKAPIAAFLIHTMFGVPIVAAFTPGPYQVWKHVSGQTELERAEEGIRDRDKVQGREAAETYPNTVQQVRTADDAEKVLETINWDNQGEWNKMLWGNRDRSVDPKQMGLMSGLVAPLDNGKTITDQDIHKATSDHMAQMAKDSVATIVTYDDKPWLQQDGTVIMVGRISDISITNPSVLEAKGETTLYAVFGIEKDANGQDVFGPLHENGPGSAQVFKTLKELTSDHANGKDQTIGFATPVKLQVTKVANGKTAASYLPVMQTFSDGTGANAPHMFGFQQAPGFVGRTGDNTSITYADGTKVSYPALGAQQGRIGTAHQVQGAGPLYLRPPEADRPIIKGIAYETSNSPVFYMENVNGKLTPSVVPTGKKTAEVWKQAIAALPDGSLWGADSGGNSLGRPSLTSRAQELSSDATQYKFSVPQPDRYYLRNDPFGFGRNVLPFGADLNKAQAEWKQKWGATNAPVQNSIGQPGNRNGVGLTAAALAGDNAVVNLADGAKLDMGPVIRGELPTPHNSWSQGSSTPSLGSGPSL